VSLVVWVIDVYESNWGVMKLVHIGILIRVKSVTSPALTEKLTAPYHHRVKTLVV